MWQFTVNSEYNAPNSYKLDGVPQIARQGCRWVTTQKRNFSFGRIQLFPSWLPQCGKYSQPLISCHLCKEPYHLDFRMSESQSSYVHISGSHSLVFQGVHWYMLGGFISSYPCLSRKKNKNVVIRKSITTCLCYDIDWWHPNSTTTFLIYLLLMHWRICIA